MLRFLYAILCTSALIACTSCDEDEKEPDRYGINRKKTETINAVVMDTQAGWTLLSEQHGFLEILHEFPDTLKEDGLKVKAEVYLGRTYFDDDEHSLDTQNWDRNFTFAELVVVEENPNLYLGPQAPVIDIFWAPDYEDFEGQIPDGYGCYIHAREGGVKIRVAHFHVVPGTGSFKTEVEAYKLGMLIMHLLMTTGGLPYTDKADFDFMKIEYYEYIPTPP